MMHLRDVYCTFLFTYTMQYHGYTLYIEYIKLILLSDEWLAFPGEKISISDAV